MRSERAGTPVFDPRQQRPEEYRPIPPGGPPRGRESAARAPGRGPSRRRLATVVAALALVAGAGGGYLTSYLGGEQRGGSSPALATTAGSTGAGQALTRVAAQVSPSVVEVTVTGDTATSEGSGLVWSRGGLIVTNAHVVAEAGSGASVTVRLFDGRTVPAKVLGTDRAHDVAVLAAQGVAGLRPVRLAGSSSVQVGEPVLAVGNPLGLQGTVTSGIVSALHRSVQIAGASQTGPFPTAQATTPTRLTGAIQTDAPVNPGSSGGALVDTSGRVIGMTTAMAALNAGSGSIGIGFAIPSADVKAVADRLIASAG